jgi:hypothetical protein
MHEVIQVVGMFFCGYDPQASLEGTTAEVFDAGSFWECKKEPLPWVPSVANKHCTSIFSFFFDKRHVVTTHLGADTAGRSPRTDESQ